MDGNEFIVRRIRLEGDFSKLFTRAFERLEQNMPTDDEFPQDAHEALMGLVSAFDAIYPDVDMIFGHVVLSDHNWDSVDWAIEHIDDNFAGVVKEYGQLNAGIWRDATLHLLRLIKVYVDEL